MAKVRVCGNAHFLILNNLFYVGFYLFVVALNFGSHFESFRSIVLKVGENRNRLILAFLCCHLFAVNVNLGMEDFLLDALVNIIADRSTNIPCVSVEILLGGIRASI